MYNKLTENTNFDVKESIWLDYFISGIFFILFILALFMDSPADSSYNPYYYKSMYIAIVPAILFAMRGKNKSVVIRINKNGIYYYGKFVTSWENYIDGNIEQDPDRKVSSISDDNVLLISYYKDGEDGCFVRKIPLTNTQDRAEEEIAEAMKYFVALAAAKNNAVVNEA